MQSPVLLIVHRAVARCLLSYFMDIDPNQIPHLEVPLHTVMKLQPKAYECRVTTFSFPIPSVDLPTRLGT
jgi:6-phosphofructo-2-kinase/fructose-2,6-biphosphatase 2